jgi:hypothetical protein
MKVDHQKPSSTPGVSGTSAKGLDGNSGDADVEQVEMDSLRASGYILAQITSDKTVGTTLNAAIQAATSIRSSFQAYNKDQLLLSDKYGDTTGTAMSSITLVSNYYQALVTLAQALGPKQKPLPDPVLSALVQLSKQLADFQSFVGQRFDEVDWSLNQIFQEVNIDFASLTRAIR